MEIILNKQKTNHYCLFNPIKYEKNCIKKEDNIFQNVVGNQAAK